MSDIRKSWDIIFNWFSLKAPGKLARVNHGATIEMIRDTEKLLGVPFTQDFVESYMIINGGFSVFPYSQDLLSLIEIVHRWQMLWDIPDRDGDIQAHPTGPINSVLWDRKWIPFTDNCGSYHCIDYNPSTGGVVGQIFYYSRDEGPIDVVATDFGTFLSQYASDLQCGKLTYDEDNGIRPVE